MIVFESLTFSYGDSGKTALDDISLRITDGEFVLLSGLSGSGKSTLLKAMNGLVPHFYGGKYKGSVTVKGLPVKAASVAELGSIVGLVFQDSSAQLVAETVDDEIAFGPANMGLSDADIEERVNKAVEMMGIDNLRGRRTATLSGGEKQKVAIAAVLSMRPAVLALDEPFAELDNESADGLLKLLVSLNKTRGMTIVMAEHRIEKATGAADRVIEVEDGKLLASATQPPASSHSKYPARKPQGRGDPVVEIKDLSFSYNGRAVFDGFDMSVGEGEIVALTGPNGCGKTTLFRLICGFLEPAGGNISVAGLAVGKADRTGLFRHIGYVPQRPSALLFAETVEEEVAGMRHDARGMSLIMEFGLDDVRNEYPRDLSWGQQQRVALAAVLAKDPKVLLLDEPTHGLDAGAKARLADLLQKLSKRGAAIIIATHDKELVQDMANSAPRVELLHLSG